MRTYIGWCIVFLGIISLIVSIKYHTVLWTGIRTEKVIKEVPSIPKVTQQEQLGVGQLDTGNLEIQAGYEITASHIPSGDYQVRDANNKIWMLKLCEAKNNGVLPNFKNDSIVNIVYTKEDGCYRFISASLIKEATK